MELWFESKELYQLPRERILVPNGCESGNKDIGYRESVNNSGWRGFTKKASVATAQSSTETAAP